MDKELFTFVGEIYEAAFNEDNWNAVLEQLCELLNAKSAGLFVHDKVQNNYYVIGSHGLPKVFEFTYRMGLGKYDLAFNIMNDQEMGQGTLIIDHEKVKDDHPVLYRAILKPYDTGYVCGINIVKTEEMHIGLGVHRSMESANFDQSQLAILELLNPHFQRSIRIQKEFKKIRSEQKNLKETLNRLMMGVLIVDKSCAVKYVNPVSESIFKQHGGLSIVDGHLKTHYAEQTKILRYYVGEMISTPDTTESTSHRAITINHPSRDAPLTVMLTRLSFAPEIEHFNDNDDCVALFVSDPDYPINVSYDSLISVYGFTEAEARVATSLVNGLSLQEIADMHAVSVQTVRVQMRQIFEKTNVNRQQDVVKLILSGALNIHGT